MAEAALFAVGVVSDILVDCHSESSIIDQTIALIMKCLQDILGPTCHCPLIVKGKALWVIAR